MKKFLYLVFLSLLSLSCAHVDYASLVDVDPESYGLHVNEQVKYSDSELNSYVQKAYNTNDNYVKVLNIGNDSLLAKVQLIRNAKKSINIQTFIWSNDEVGRLFVYELYQAAQRGVKISIIVDHLSFIKHPEFLATLHYLSHNVSLKVYNPLSKSIKPSKLQVLSAISIDFMNTNQRMHNKLFIVDDVIAITGGRNIANDYYDRGTNRNFKDREMLIIGSLVKSMTDSFAKYWSFQLSLSADHMVNFEKKDAEFKYEETYSKKAFRWGKYFDDLEQCLEFDNCFSDRVLRGIHKVNKIEFVADEPGKSEKHGEYKVSKTADSLIQFMSNAKESIIIQSPYLVVGKKGTKLFKKIRKEKPELEILVSSNSLAAADYVHAYAFSYKNKKKYIKKFKWRVFELRPDPLDVDIMTPKIEAVKRSKNYYTCIHAKTYIADNDKIWIGSYNLDPRSGTLNTEVGVVIQDEKITRMIREDIYNDMSNRNSWTIGKRKKVPLISRFSGILDDIMEIMPIVYIWPFQYTASYELKEGKEEVPYYHEDFFENYKFVGPFPKAVLSDKEIKARLIKTFAGPLEGLI